MDIRYRPRAFAEFHESLVLIETDTAFGGLELDIQDGLGGGDGCLGGHGWCKLRGNNNNYLLWDWFEGVVVLLLLLMDWIIELAVDLIQLILYVSFMSE